MFYNCEIRYPRFFFTSILVNMSNKRKRQSVLFPCVPPKPAHLLGKTERDSTWSGYPLLLHLSPEVPSGPQLSPAVPSGPKRSPAVPSGPPSHLLPPGAVAGSSLSQNSRGSGPGVKKEWKNKKKTCSGDGVCVCVGGGVRGGRGEMRPRWRGRSGSCPGH